MIAEGKADMEMDQFRIEYFDEAKGWCSIYDSSRAQIRSVQNFTVALETDIFAQIIKGDGEQRNWRMTYTRCENQPKES